MYLTPSITTQTFKELHIIYPLSKGIPNQCICSSRLTRTAQVLCGDTENVLLLCCFDLFSLLIFFFFPCCLLTNQNQSPQSFLFTLCWMTILQLKRFTYLFQVKCVIKKNISMKLLPFS